MNSYTPDQKETLATGSSHSFAETLAFSQACEVPPAPKEARTLDLIGDHLRAARAGVPSIDARDAKYLDTPTDPFSRPRPTVVCRGGHCVSID